MTENHKELDEAWVQIYVFKYHKLPSILEAFCEELVYDVNVFVKEESRTIIEGVHPRRKSQLSNKGEDRIL